jgi:hypothetical protein
MWLLAAVAFDNARVQTGSPKSNQGASQKIDFLSSHSVYTAVTYDALCCLAV